MFWFILFGLFTLALVLDFLFADNIDNFIEGFGFWFFNKRTAGDRIRSIVSWVVTDGAWIILTLIHYCIWRRDVKNGKS